MRPLEGVYLENLAFTVGSAMRTGNVRGDTALALRTCLELGRAPAVCATSHLLLHFGCSALGYSHDISGLMLAKLLIFSS